MPRRPPSSPLFPSPTLFHPVDNAPTDDSTRRVVQAVAEADPRFRYVREPRPGLSCARNRGLAEARGEVLAYTDEDRKSTRLNSSHANISYAVFCLKKKNKLS